MRILGSGLRRNLREWRPLLWRWNVVEDGVGEELLVQSLQKGQLAAAGYCSWCWTSVALYGPAILSSAGGSRRAVGSPAPGSVLGPGRLFAEQGCLTWLRADGRVGKG